MPWGGTITVRHTAERWHVTGTAERVKVDRALWDALPEPGRPLAVSSAEVEFPLARVTAARLNRALTVETGANGVSVTF
jgi:hypothetical protein